MKALINNSNRFTEIEKRLGNIKPYISMPIISEPFYNDFKILLCWSSNAIEGNTLTLKEITDFLIDDEVSNGHKFSEYEDAKRLNHAIEKFCVPNKMLLNEENIKSMNYIITGQNIGYREQNVYIGTKIESVYYPPSYKAVPKCMKNFIEDINFTSDSISEVIHRTAEKHIDFERIHPFLDGNGRTGRIILNRYLINNGLLPISITPKSKYRDAFMRFEKSGDLSPMERIIALGELESIKNVEILIEKAMEKNLISTESRKSSQRVDSSKAKTEMP